MRQAELRVASGKQMGSSIPLPVGKFLIGREEDCNLRPNSDLVSRHHCVFTVDEYAVRVRDLGSTNGTLVNGERIRGGVVLSAGDIVSIGKIDFQVVIQEAANDTATHMTLDSETRMIPAAAPDVVAEILEEPDATSLDEVSSSDTVQIPVHQAIPTLGPGSPPSGDTQLMGQMGMPMQPSLGYPQMGYPQMAYPQMMPYGYPGMPQMGYPMQSPMQGMYPPQGMYPQQGMPQAPQAAEPEPAKPAIQEPGLRLPDPETTGAKPPEPKPAPTSADAKTADAKNKEEAPKRAADIINQYRGRRPTT